MKVISLRVDKDTEIMLSRLILKKKHLSQNAIICEAVRQMARVEGVKNIYDNSL